MDLSLKLFFTEFNRKLDELEARWERRSSPPMKESRVAGEELRVGGLEQFGAASQVVADNWGGWFEEPLYVLEKRICEQRPAAIDAVVVPDNWGGLFEQPAHTALECDLFADAVFATGQIRIDNGFTSSISVAPACLTPASTAASAAIWEIEPEESLPMEYLPQIQGLEETVQDANIVALEEALSKREARMGTLTETPHHCVSLVAPALDVVFDSELSDPRSPRTRRPRGAPPHLPRLRQGQAPPRPLRIHRLRHLHLRRPRFRRPRRVRLRSLRLQGQLLIQGRRPRLRARSWPRPRPPHGAPRVRLRRRSRCAAHVREGSVRTLQQAPQRGEEEHAEHHPAVQQRRRPNRVGVDTLRPERVQDVLFAVHAHAASNPDPAATTRLHRATLQAAKHAVGFAPDSIELAQFHVVLLFDTDMGESVECIFPEFEDAMDFVRSVCLRCNPCAEAATLPHGKYLWWLALVPKVPSICVTSLVRCSMLGLYQTACILESAAAPLCNTQHLRLVSDLKDSAVREDSRYLNTFLDTHLIGVQMFGYVSCVPPDENKLVVWIIQLQKSWPPLVVLPLWPTPWPSFDCRTVSQLFGASHVQASNLAGLDCRVETVIVGSQRNNSSTHFLVPCQVEIYVASMDKVFWQPPLSFRCSQIALQIASLNSVEWQMLVQGIWSCPNEGVFKSRGIDQWWIPWPSLECSQGVVWEPFQKLIVSFQQKHGEASLIRAVVLQQLSRNDVVAGHGEPDCDFTLTTSFIIVDASSYATLVILGGLQILLSVSKVGCALLQVRVQRKGGGNCQCFLLQVSGQKFRVATPCTKCKVFCWELMLLHKGFLTINKEVQYNVNCLRSTYLEQEFPQFPWDPGGSELLHRLEGKPKFKKGGMSDTTPSWAVIWLMGLGRQAMTWTVGRHLQLQEPRGSREPAIKRIIK